MGSTRTRYGNGGNGKPYYLSVVDPLDESVSENIKLPFDEDDAVYGGSCVGWLYFHNLCGKIVIFNNLTSKEFEVLPPPEYPEPELFSLNGCGLGYNSKSGDYKVVRNYAHHYCENGETETSGCTFNLVTDLYSFKLGSWKTITTPDLDLITSNGIYVGETECCYWIATCFDLLEDDFFIVSFDFATENFARFALPLTTSKFPIRFTTLVECGGLLGAIGQTNLHESYMELYVRKGQVWNRLYNLFLARVDGVLGVNENGQLLVRDLVNRRWKKLSIYDYEGIMNGLCLYVESTDLLPLGDSKPKTSEDVEERKIRSKNRRLRVRMKTSRGERMRTVSKKKTSLKEEIKPRRG